MNKLTPEQCAQLTESVESLKAHIQLGAHKDRAGMLPPWVLNMLTIAGPEIVTLLQQLLAAEKAVTNPPPAPL